MAELDQVTLPRTLARTAVSATASSRYQPNNRIPNTNTPIYDATIQSLRSGGAVAPALRLMTRKEGTLSSAVFSFVEIAKSGLQIKAYDNNSSVFNSQATELAMSLFATLDTLGDYTQGYADLMTVPQLQESMLREAVLTNQVACELVLDKSRLPEKIVIAPFESLEWRSDGNGGKYPVQLGAFTGKGEVSLDIPTFWTASLHQDMTSSYATPMMESALDTTYYFEEFIQDMRRVVRKSGHTRTVATLDSEKVRNSAPAEVQKDPDKLKAFMDEVSLQVQRVLSALEPEDALVVYDTAETQLLSDKSAKTDYTELLSTISGQLATSLKSHPSILGLRLEGSQSLSNTESLIFLKIAKAIQRPVADVLSRAMTLAVRLFGVEAYVKVAFNPINLRPEDELEAYRTMQQSRILERLSLGLITDEEAAVELGTFPLPANYRPLSGTFFHQGTGNIEDLVAMTNGAQETAMVPDTPTKAGGRSQ